MQENVYRAVMVAFLVYAGMLATRHSKRGGGVTRTSACDIVAEGTHMAYKGVANKWGCYKKFMPFQGDNPVGLSVEQADLWGLHEGKTGIQSALWGYCTDSERRREFYRSIYRTRNDFPNCQLPNPV